MSVEGPRREYERRRGEREAEIAATEARSATIGRFRLLTAVAWLAIAWAALDRGLVAWTWMWLPAVGFAALVVWHGRVKATADRARRAAGLYERGLARLDGQWRGHGARGDDFVPPDHLYAVDLDLFGDGSLFQLLSRARTRHGERRLAAWLTVPSRPEEILARQAVVEELRDRLDLREDLALAGEEVRSAVDADRLEAWGRARGAFASPILPLLAAASSLSTLLAFSLYAAEVAPAWPLFAAVLTQAVVYRGARSRIDEALHGVDRATNDLVLLTELVRRLESERLGSPRGIELLESLRSHGASASDAIHDLRRRLEIHDSGRNLLFMPVAIVLLWPVHGAYWIDRWRQRFGAAVGTWLEATGEIEAISSLAGHAYENPEDTFPVVDTSGAPRFDADALGHPLLPDMGCVRNDVAFGAAAQALIVSGSNMSGKTTLLRAVGTNAVLALAGATVRARRLEIGALRIGASIRTQDSLLDGRSRFQAEIDRIRDVMQLARNAPPILFLLDEVLAGTNSHDRRIGAAAIVQGLLEVGAIGLVTTHDLALAELDTEGERRIENVHFEDQIEDGRMRFDYRMRPGVVRRSNAIELMRSVGIPV